MRGHDPHVFQREADEVWPRPLGPRDGRVSFALVTIPPVRIGTWNVDRERARHTSAERREILDALKPDVMVVTEPGPWWDRPAVFSSRQRPPMRPGWPSESWVAIEGARVEELELGAGYGRMSTAALATVSGVPVLVYGSVLPWNGIKEAGLLQPGERYRDAFPRLLGEQAADVRGLSAEHPDALVIWAGDFNQALAPPHYVGALRIVICSNELSINLVLPRGIAGSALPTTKRGPST